MRRSSSPKQVQAARGCTQASPGAHLAGEGGQRSRQVGELIEEHLGLNIARFQEVRSTAMAVEGVKKPEIGLRRRLEVARIGSSGGGRRQFGCRGPPVARPYAEDSLEAAWA